jgi:hypothetical protein
LPIRTDCRRPSSTLPFLPGEVFLTVRQFGLDTLPCAKSGRARNTRTLSRKGKEFVALAQ